MFKKISLEGPSNKLKEKQIEKIKEYLDNKDIKYIYSPNFKNTFEPDEIEKGIIDVLETNKDKFLRIGNPITEALLIFSLTMYRQSKYEKYLKDCEIYLSNRSIDTWIAYATPSIAEHTNKTYEDVIDWLISISKDKWKKPDITFYLISKDPFKEDKYTKEEKEYLKKVLKVYDMLYENKEYMKYRKIEYFDIEENKTNIIDLIESKLN